MNLSMLTVKTVLQAALDIFVMWLILYYALRLVRSNSRTIQIFKGILLIIAVDVLAKIFGLSTLEFFADIFLNWGFLAIIIIFQPEIRSLLEKMGKSNLFTRMTTLTGNEKENLVDQIVTAVMLLSKDQTGALISIEQSHSLDDFIATGTPMNSDVTAELLTSIFVTSTPLHDGAVIIQGDKIACASAYFPPTNLELPSRYGARHRAAIGISEITDCVTIVVSEETGNVSITEGGKIFTVNRNQLRDYLLRVICGEVTEVHSNDSNKGNGQSTSKPSMMAKFAVRKQNSDEEKIEVEEVTPAQDTVVDKEMSTSEQVHKAADQEAIAAEIKLPHKKRRPKPIYPTQNRLTSTRVTNTTENKATEKKSKTESIQTTTKVEVENVVQKTETAPVKRMTPAEVQAAREAAMQQLSHKEESVPKAKPILNDADRKFDTTKLDISKIVGFNGELDRQFKMVDQMPEDKKTSDKNGGEEK